MRWRAWMVGGQGGRPWRAARQMPHERCRACSPTRSGRATSFVGLPVRWALPASSPGATPTCDRVDLAVRPEAAQGAMQRRGTTRRPLAAGSTQEPNRTMSRRRASDNHCPRQPRSRGSRTIVAADMPTPGTPAATRPHQTACPPGIVNRDGGTLLDDYDELEAEPRPVPSREDDKRAPPAPRARA
jgi:hypothetical protein